MEEHGLFKDYLEQTVPVPMKRGGILLLDGLTFHKIGVNSTNKTRRSITFAYHSIDELSGHKDEPYKLLVRGERLVIGNFSHKNI